MINGPAGQRIDATHKPHCKGLFGEDQEGGVSSSGTQWSCYVFQVVGVITLKNAPNCGR